jgi:hypothetical protein
VIHHYTDRDSAAAILRGGAILPHPVPVYADFDGPMTGARPTVLDSVVWFTAASEPSQTTFVKLMLDGLSPGVPGDIWRFSVDDATAPEGLIAWAGARGYPPALFRWMILTAHLVHEDYTAWRLSSVAVARTAWRSVQSLHGRDWKDEEH